MYNDMYNTFDKEKIPYNFPHSFQEKKQFDYLNSEKPTYDIDYGDTVTFPFKIDCGHEYWDIDIIVYNFRYEEIMRVSTSTNEDGIVFLPIDHETSEKLFKRGLYYVRVQAYDCSIIGAPATVSTLISPSDCCIRVR